MAAKWDSNWHPHCSQTLRYSLCVSIGVLAQHSLLSAGFQCSTMFKVVQSNEELRLKVGVKRAFCTAKVQIPTNKLRNASKFNCYK